MKVELENGQVKYVCDKCGTPTIVGRFDPCPYISCDYGWRYENKHQWFHFCDKECEKHYWNKYYRRKLQINSVTSNYCINPPEVEHMYDEWLKELA